MNEDVFFDADESISALYAFVNGASHNHDEAIKAVNSVHHLLSVDREALWGGGEPKNLKAAALDSLEWLKFLQNQMWYRNPIHYSDENREKLDAALEALESFLPSLKQPAEQIVAADLLQPHSSASKGG